MKEVFYVPLSVINVCHNFGKAYAEYEMEAKKHVVREDKYFWQKKGGEIFRKFPDNSVSKKYSTAAAGE